MATIYELKKRAKELAAVSETNTVDPARVGNLIDDTLELIDEYDKNVVSLGIRKTYATVAAMEADKSPSGDDGKKLRFGQLVSVYDTGNAEAMDNGKVFAWQNPGWKLSNRVDAGYARSEKVAELDIKISYENSKKAYGSDTEEDGAYFTNEHGEVFAEYTPDGFNTNPSDSFKEKINAGIEERVGAIEKKLTTNTYGLVDTEEDGAYFTNEHGEVFAEYKNGKFSFNGAGISTTIKAIEDIENVKGGRKGQFLKKLENGDWGGADIGIPSGDRVVHPLYGKHFFVLGDSHTEAPGFLLWQTVAKDTGSTYHTLLKKTFEVNGKNEIHFISAVCDKDNNYIYDPSTAEDTGVIVNADGFNWSNYVDAAYKYAQTKNFNIDYIIVENSHFAKWNIFNSDGSLVENIPVICLKQSKDYTQQIFADAGACADFAANAANFKGVIHDLGINERDSSFRFYYGGKSQTINLSFSNGNSLSIDTIITVHFGGSSKKMSTNLVRGMSITDCIDNINQWAFSEYSGWSNDSTKGTQGNTEILVTHSDSAGSYNDLLKAVFAITPNSNLIASTTEIIANTSDIKKAIQWPYIYGSKSIEGITLKSNWMSPGGAYGWSYPNAMLGAIAYMGEKSPYTKFVFCGLRHYDVKADMVYADGSVNPYKILSTNSYKATLTSNKSIEDLAKAFGFQYIDVGQLSGINAFNAYPTYGGYNNVHHNLDGYREWAKCITKYIK